MKPAAVTMKLPTVSLPPVAGGPQPAATKTYYSIRNGLGTEVGRVNYTNVDPLLEHSVRVGVPVCVLAQMGYTVVPAIWELPADVYVDPTVDQLTDRLLSVKLGTEARLLGVSPVTLAEALISAFIKRL